jgi:hypothetical protein
VKKALVPLALLLMSVITITGCARPSPTVTITTTATSTVTAKAPVTTPATSPVPEYHFTDFTVFYDKNYTYPIYIRKDETLHLLWMVHGNQSEVWFYIITPSGKPLGFYEYMGEESKGVPPNLAEGSAKGMTGGITQFCPQDYGWTEGYYTILVRSHDQPANVIANWWLDVSASPAVTATTIPPTSTAPLATTAGPVPVLESIIAEPVSVDLAGKATVQLRITAKYNNGYTEVVTFQCRYEIDNDKIATVSAGGKVTAVAAGTARIFVYYTIGNLIKIASIPVIVR